MMNLKNILKWTLLGTVWGLLVLMTVPLMLVFMPVYWLFCPQAFARGIRYKRFLRQMEGECFFIYRHQKDEKEFVETHVLTGLGENVHVVVVNGRQTQSNFNRMLMSDLISDIRDRRGFPYLIKIQNGKITDQSLKEELMQCLSKSSDSQVLLLLAKEFYYSEPVAEHLQISVHWHRGSQ